MELPQVVRDLWYLVDHHGHRVIARCAGEMWVGWEGQPKDPTDLIVFQTAEGRLFTVEAEQVLERVEQP